MFRCRTTFSMTTRTAQTPRMEAKMRVFGHMTERDLKIDKLGPPPEGLSEAEMANWNYQRYIKEYLRCVVPQLMTM